MGDFSNKIKDFFWKFKQNKKAQIIVLVVVLVLAVTIIGLFVFLSKEKQETVLKNENVNIEKETVRHIDGIEVEEGKENLFPWTIVIENYVSVRPQAGLQEANLVYEFLAEGGITRFLAVYASGEHIELIGPVRSARHYIVALAEEYHGLFAHIGGSPQALGILNVNDYLTDLNQFGYSQYYWRDAGLAAPHNLFTSSDLMSFAQRDLNGDNEEGTYTPYKFKEKEEKPAEPTEEKYIQVNLSSGSYNVEWKYDSKNANYLRFNGGVEHRDKATDEQLKAKNIIVQFSETSLLAEGTGRIDIQTIGEGEAIVFSNGEATVGTWKKEERGDRTLFYDSEGDEIEFNPGKIWIEIVPTDKEVLYN